jgi:N-acetylmuramoyl-L-alanine amidase
MKQCKRIRGLVAIALAVLFLFPGFSLGQTAKRVVIIDAAHGGKDRGVQISDKISEKDITLNLARMLQKELGQGSGLSCVLTRDSDRDLSDAERIDKVAAQNPVAVISLHVNAGFGKASRGFEVYFAGFQKEKIGKNEGAGAIINDMQQTKHLNDSVRLARAIQDSMDAVFKKENRGLREAPMALFYGLSVPAVVVEVGFATNSDNRKILTSDKGQQAIVRALGKGIREGLP